MTKHAHQNLVFNFSLSIYHISQHGKSNSDFKKDELVDYGSSWTEDLE